MSTLKSAARAAATEIRNAVPAAAMADAPLALAAHRFPHVAIPGRNTVSGFFPYQSEIDTRPLLGRLAGEGWTTCLPIVVAMGQPLVFRRWLPGAPTISGKWNIQRPPDEAPLVRPDILLVPMLAFDRKGYRLGYGGGFYDRTLAQLRAEKPVVAIGVAYAAQEIDRVPHADHDQPVDYVMTEKEVLRCG